MVTPEHIGRYVGLQLIGVGSFGNVYRATDSDNGSLVAIKVLNQEFSLDLAWVTRFQQEAGFMAQIGDHPNVVKVFDLQQEGDTFYIVMELLPGREPRNPYKYGTEAQPQACGGVGLYIIFLGLLPACELVLEGGQVLGCHRGIGSSRGLEIPH